MPSIAEFSDEPKHSIKAVCAQTGIQAVTLRAWERRHEVITPHRSDNRYRLYSDRDVALLQWIKQRVDQGSAISSVINDLRSMQRNNIWPDAIPVAPASQPTQRATASPSEYSRRLFQALIHHDEATAGDIYREIHASFDILTLFTKIINPVLVSIGDAWYHGEIRVATEHFASNYVRGKLLTLYQAYPTHRSGPYIMVGCAPTEQHEIGSLMLSILLRSNGYRVEYLGADIPLEDLLDYAKHEKPRMIILAAFLDGAALELRHFQEKAARLRPAPLFGYGGLAFVQQPALIQKIPGNFLGKTLDESLQNVQALLPK
ncbi:MAG TPA: MerR family transcriptional regulator [Anaerolineaceae bacterium]|nr:MerR family transcriptional regulator [Anaerolineaceae bacterium]